MSFINKYSHILSEKFFILKIDNIKYDVFIKDTENINENLIFSYIDNYKVIDIKLSDIINKDIEVYPYSYKKGIIETGIKRTDFELFQGGIFESIGLGWTGILKNLHNDIKHNLTLLKNNDISFGIKQIKEKMGGLRIYVSLDIKNKNPITEIISNRIHYIIHKAENNSEYVCEICGDSCQRKNINNWYFTVCYKHECDIVESGFNKVSKGHMIT